MKQVGSWLRQAGMNFTGAVQRFMMGRYGHDRLNMALLIVGLVLSVACLIYLCFAAGRSPKLAGIKPGGLNRLPLDIYGLLLGAVLLILYLCMKEVAEELLFRGLLIRLFRPFGDASAILLSALLFALAHGSLFQMPYAFVAGLFLGLAATASGGILFPLLFHFLYNLLTFFGGKIPTLPLLWSLGGLAAFSLLLFLLGKHPKLTKGDVRPSVRELLPLLCYAVLMAVFAALNF